jgi:AcrR family transcriptional regulator
MKNATQKKTRRAGDEGRWQSRREQILDAAAKLFAEHGYADTDTQLLADKLGVGKGTVYRYFPSKQDIFLATADRVMRNLREQVDASIVGIEDPLDRIAEAIRAYLAFFADHPDSVELLMQERAQFKDRKKPTYFEHREANIERWRALYRALIAEGRIRDMPVERITDVLGDLVYGTMFTNYFIGRRKPFEAQAQDILDIVFHGILSDAERRKRTRVNQIDMTS